MTPENLKILKNLALDKQVSPALAWGQQTTVNTLMNLARMDEMRALAERLIAESGEPAFHRLARMILDAVAEAAKIPPDSDEEASRG